MTTAAISAETQTEKIFAWRRGFNAMHLIDIGVEVGLFKALAAAPAGLTSVALAQQLGLHAHFVNVWCTTAYSFELLEGDEATRQFKLAPFIDKILASPGHPRYLGGYVRLGTEFATDDFRRCDESFKSGKTIPFQGRGEEFANTIADGTMGLQVMSARKILPELTGLGDKLGNGGAVLEIGCGAGNHLLQLANAFPNARIAGVDIDTDSLNVARAKLAKAGLENRVSVFEGDIELATRAGKFDAIVMIEVLHEIAPALRQPIVGASANALAPDGYLVIIDETYPTTLAQTREKDFLFPVQTGFEELMWGNVIPTREEQESLLRNAGFSGEIQRSIIGEGFTLLTVQKLLASQ
jgi:SAM-dependent methyltransferase